MGEGGGERAGVERSDGRGWKERAGVEGSGQEGSG